MSDENKAVAEPRGESNALSMSMFANSADYELARIRQCLGLVGADSHADPVAVIEMIRGWESDAQVRVDMLERHLRAVIEIARTWQPDYATKMDRDTLQYAEDFADRKKQ